jgi:hypothetical protein
VTRIVLRAALAARDAALNREDLAGSEKTAVAKAPENVHPADFDPSGNLSSRSQESAEGTTSYFVALPSAPKAAPIAIAPRTVPDVKGLSIREAVRALHAAGFRVRIANASTRGTLPVAGTVATPGTIVQLNRVDE